MSASKSKSKQTETQTTSGTATTTPNTPDWLLSPIQGTVGGISALLNSGQPLTPGASPLQLQAQNAAAGLTPQTVPMAGGKPDPNLGPQVNGGPGDGFVAPGAPTGGMGGGNNFDLARMLTLGGALGGAVLAGPAAQASSEGFTREGLNARMSPYTEQVVDASLADYDVMAGSQRGGSCAQTRPT